MSQLLLSYEDLQGIAAASCPADVEILGCGSTAGNKLQLLIRVKLGAYVPGCSDKNRLLARAVLALELLDADTLALRLAELSFDKSNVPLLIRPVISPGIVSGQLFQRIPTDIPGVDVDKEAEAVTLRVSSLLEGRVDRRVTIHVETAAFGKDGLELAGRLITG